METVKIKIPKYHPENGIIYNWEDDFEIKTSAEGIGFKITANKAGLVSLANHLLNLAQDGIPTGYHIHLDSYNSLGEDSLDLTIEKV
ncbi:Imm32 family immunity protein [Flavobacterium cerinum]|uniref:Uncharacterized protein n=1 Tax=Flavobacterium cerinum TaxID=2502784 RepID=A0ABY5IVF5_9FLAO|nr:hypothetical protein [Flavobacterium cerinum]UUC46361.1 hypothetical protein NOX80_03955 [Flavobacterium cerinum]